MGPEKIFFVCKYVEMSSSSTVFGEGWQPDLLRRAGDRAEEPQAAALVVDLAGGARQRDGHEDGLMELPLPGLHRHDPAHLHGPTERRLHQHRLGLSTQLLFLRVEER